MSRQKQLITVFVVANAQKQGAIEGECIEPRSATMFQEVETAEPKRFLAGGCPASARKKTKDTRWKWSVITRDGRAISVEFPSSASRIADACLWQDGTFRTS